MPECLLPSNPPAIALAKLPATPPPVMALYPRSPPPIMALYPRAPEPIMAKIPGTRTVGGRTSATKASTGCGCELAADLPEGSFGFARENDVGAMKAPESPKGSFGFSRTIPKPPAFEPDLPERGITEAMASVLLDVPGEAATDWATLERFIHVETLGGPAPGALVTFSVLGDVPYCDREMFPLAQIIAAHNRRSGASFVVHVGDIAGTPEGAMMCSDWVYRRAAFMLGMFRVPVFVLPGDNDWSGCGDVDGLGDRAASNAGWARWKTHLADFHRRWPERPNVETPRTEFRTAPFPVFGSNELRQVAFWPDGRRVTDQGLYNVAFRKDGVLFIGVNYGPEPTDYLGGQVARVRADAARWIRYQLRRAATQDVRAAVITAQARLDHSNIREPDTVGMLVDEFLAFERPILWAQGDEHAGRGWYSYSVTTERDPAGSSLARRDVRNLALLVVPVRTGGTGGAGTAEGGRLLPPAQVRVLMRPVDPERPGTIFEWNVDPDWLNRDIEEYGAPSPAERAARERVRDVTCQAQA